MDEFSVVLKGPRVHAGCSHHRHPADRGLSQASGLPTCTSRATWRTEKTDRPLNATAGHHIHRQRQAYPQTSQLHHLSRDRASRARACPPNTPTAPPGVTPANRRTRFFAMCFAAEILLPYPQFKPLVEKGSVIGFAAVNNRCQAVCELHCRRPARALPPWFQPPVPMFLSKVASCVTWRARPLYAAAGAWIAPGTTIHRRSQLAAAA